MPPAMFVAVVALVALTALVALPTVMDAGLVHVGMLPFDVRIWVDVPMVSLESAVLPV